MRKYSITMTYSRPSGSDAEVTVEVEAVSENKARQIATRQLRANPRRKVEELKSMKSHEVKPPVAAVAADPETIIRAGKFFANRVTNQRMKIAALYTSDGGTAMAVVEYVTRGSTTVMTVAELRQMLRPKLTVEYWAVYPTDMVYRSNSPIMSSQYGLENIIQMKVTKRDGKIVAKELL